MPFKLSKSQVLQNLIKLFSEKGIIEFKKISTNDSCPSVNCFECECFNLLSKKCELFLLIPQASRIVKLQKLLK